MATNPIRIEVSKGSLDAATAAIIGKTLNRIGATAKVRAQQIIGQELNDQSGDLKSSITFSLDRDGDEVVLLLESTAGKYALYQHEGTGIYGEGKGASGLPIRPTNGEFLRWFTDKSGRSVPSSKAGKLTAAQLKKKGWTAHYAREVRGVKAKKFLTRAATFAIKKVLA